MAESLCNELGKYKLIGKHPPFYVYTRKQNRRCFRSGSFEWCQCYPVCHSVSVLHTCMYCKNVSFNLLGMFCLHVKNQSPACLLIEY